MRGEREQGFRPDDVHKISSRVPAAPNMATADEKPHRELTRRQSAPERSGIKKLTRAATDGCE